MKTHAPPLDDAARGRLIMRASRAAVTVALSLLVVKLGVWLVSGSVALLGAVADSGLDLVASGVTLVANRAALVPADEDHRFGHGKAEALAGLAQATFVGVSAVLVGVAAVYGLFHYRPVQRPDLGIGVSLLAVVITLGLVIYQRLVVRRTGSMSVAGDSLHYVGDLALNGAVAVAIFLSQWGIRWADPVFGIAVALFIMNGAWGLGRDAVDVLMDRELPESDRERIVEVALQEPEVHGVHDLRTRRSGGHTFIQLHLDFPAEMTVREAHDIGERVEFAIIDALQATEVFVHQDPVEPGGAHSH
jgi:ferrous-iron efflux pump FieF